MRHFSCKMYFRFKRRFGFNFFCMSNACVSERFVERVDHIFTTAFYRLHIILLLGRKRSRFHECGHTYHTIHRRTHITAQLREHCCVCTFLKDDVILGFLLILLRILQQNGSFYKSSVEITYPVSQFIYFSLIEYKCNN